MGASRILILDSYGRILIHDFGKKITRAIEGEKDIKLISGGCIDSKNFYVLLGDNTVLSYDIDSEKFNEEKKIDNVKYLASCRSLKGFFSATDNCISRHESLSGAASASVEFDDEITCLMNNQEFLFCGGAKGMLGVYSCINCEMLKLFNNTPNRISCIGIQE